MKQNSSSDWLSANLRVFRWVWQASPAKVFWELFLKVFQSVLETVTTVWLLYYIMEMVASSGSFSKFVMVLSLLLALQLLLAFMQHWYHNCWKERCDLDLSSYMQQLLMEKKGRICLCHYDDPISYDLMARAQACADQTVGAAFQNIVNTAGFVGMMVSSAVMIWQIDPLLLCLGVLAFPAVWVSRKLNAALYQYQKAVTPAKRKQEYVKKSFLKRDFALEIRLTQISRVLRRQSEQASAEIEEQVHKYGKKLSFYDFLCDQLYINLIMMICYLYALLQLLVFHNLEISEFSVMLVASTSFISRLRRIFFSVETAQSYSLSVRDLLEFLALPPPAERNMEIGEIREIVLKDVSFRYPGSKREAVSHLNLTIRSGEKIVLAGYNGAGKSTLIKLLLGFYDLSAGEICCNGISLEELNKASYRRHFGVLFQDFQIYRTTVAENVLLRPYDPAADSAKVWEALERCGLAEQIRSLPQQEQTPLFCEFEPDGLVLSGGQQQKLAIARLWVRDYDVAILDEPSAALDPVAESELLEQIFTAAAGKTLLLISHRLSSALSADRVVLLENGQIIEEGSHTQLMKRKGKYARYFALQAEKYQD